MEAIVPTPQVKMWRPPNLVGVEINIARDLPFYGRRTYHTEYQFTALLHGQATAHYRRQQVDNFVDVHADPLSCVQSPDEIVHIVGQGAPASFCTIKIDVESVERMLREIGLTQRASPVAFVRVAPSEEVVSRSIGRLMRHFVQSVESHTPLLEQQTLLLRLLTQTVLYCGDRPVRLPTPGHEHHAVRAIKDYIHDQLDHAITLDDLATISHLNKFYALEVFSRDVGISPHVYLTHVRLHKARQLLARGKPIAQVAHDVGFVDQSHLHRQFKRTFHITPGQFQRDSIGG